MEQETKTFKDLYNEIKDFCQKHKQKKKYECSPYDTFDVDFKEKTVRIQLYIDEFYVIIPLPKKFHKYL